MAGCALFLQVWGHSCTYCWGPGRGSALGCFVARLRLLDLCVCVLFLRLDSSRCLGFQRLDRRCCFVFCFWIYGVVFGCVSFWGLEFIQISGAAFA